MMLLAAPQFLPVDQERLPAGAHETDVAGLPIVVLPEGYLPDDVPAIFFSGPHLFDPAHPERTVVLRKGGA